MKLITVVLISIVTKLSHAAFATAAAAAVEFTGRYDHLNRLEETGGILHSSAYIGFKRGGGELYKSPNLTVLKIGKREVTERPELKEYALVHDTIITGDVEKWYTGKEFSEWSMPWEGVPNAQLDYLPGYSQCRLNERTGDYVVKTGTWEGTMKAADFTMDLSADSHATNTEGFSGYVSGSYTFIALPATWDKVNEILRYTQYKGQIPHRIEMVTYEHIENMVFQHSGTPQSFHTHHGGMGGSHFAAAAAGGMTGRRGGRSTEGRSFHTHHGGMRGSHSAAAAHGGMMGPRGGRPAEAAHVTVELSPDLLALVQEGAMTHEQALELMPPMITEAVEDHGISVSALLKDGTAVISVGARDRGSYPQDICAVIDVSASMNEIVSGHRSLSEEEAWNVLDLVKHSVWAVAKSLNVGDRLSVIVYDNYARTIFDLQPLTDRSLLGLERTLKPLNPTPGGGTNIWDGIRMGMRTLSDNSDPERNSVLFLLTDGVPTKVAPYSHEKMLKMYIEENGFNGTINTFGFGYHIQSNMLSNIAKIGRGMFNFIADRSVVGSVFVDSVSNALVTMSPNISIGFVLPTTDGRQVQGQEEFGALLIEQSRDFVIQIPTGIQLTMAGSVTVSVGGFDGTSTPVTMDVTVKVAETDDEKHYVDVQNERQTLISKLKEAISATDAMKYCSDIKSTFSTFSAGEAITDPNLVSDFDEVERGLTPTQFHRWGRHYIRSLLQAHELQQKTNFKDKGLEMYGGGKFLTCEERLEQNFMTVIPPVYHHEQHEQRPASRVPTTAERAALAAARREMYYNQSGGCFHGNCLVRTENGQEKRMKDIQKGDSVMTDNGALATVQTVVEFKCPEQGIMMTDLPNGPVITPYHPVKTNDGKWIFPANVEASKTKMMSTCQSVYNVVLSEKDRKNAVLVNGTACCTLGHNLKGDVIGHNFFGNEIVSQLSQSESGRFDVGRMTFKPECFIRDPKSGEVCGIDLAKEVI